MGKGRKIVFRKDANKDIVNIHAYIRSKTSTSFAGKFIDQLTFFCEDIAVYPEKYAVCRFVNLVTKGYRCAVFKFNYIVVYRILVSEIRILGVIRTSQLSE